MGCDYERYIYHDMSQLDHALAAVRANVENGDVPSSCSMVVIPQLTGENQQRVAPCQRNQ